ncbi:MAG: hypothetical protein V4658_13605 [Bacteroidota bacterium]
MSLKEAQHKLSADISNLYETYQLISKNKQQFNDLDVALLQQQLLYIYHSLLKVQSQFTNIPEPAELIPVVTGKPAVEEKAATSLFSAIEEPVAVTPEPQAEQPKETAIPQPEMVEEPAHVEPVKEEPPVVAEPEPIAEPEPVIPEPTLEDLEKLMREQEAKEEAQKPVVNTEEHKQPELAADPAKPQITEATLSLLDKLTANMRTPDVHEKIAREQMSLKQAINLNKKIAFVNNLFNENTVEYAKAIERLNSATGSHEALRYFSELKHQYNWNNENPLVKDLEQLIEKRYT